MPLWASALLWLALAVLFALAIWTMVRTPGEEHDPGRRRNRPEEDRED